jgi:riboflavin-specific deaminase-like protein
VTVSTAGSTNRVAVDSWYVRAVEFRQLLPEPRTVELSEQLTRMHLADGAPDELPYTIANFVTSVDGRATFHGRSGALGDDGDHAMFHGLREQVDGVLIGPGTLRAERYGRIIRELEARERRSRRGLSPEPLACTVSRTGAVPTDIPLFSEPEARIVVFTSTELDISDCDAAVEVVPLDPGEMTLTTALRHLRTDHEIRALLCEGGPTLFGALLQEGLVHELFLTLAPKLTGGGAGPTASSGPELPALCPLQVRWLLERAGSLYLRYGLVV